MPSEASARIVIDRLLREAGWDVENPARVSTEEAAADGRADYLMKNQRTQPLCVLEAKRFSTDPYSAKAQAKAYALQLGAPFVILSNGREHYFWEYETGDARPVVGFPSPADLERRANLRQHRAGSVETSLKAVPIPRRFRSQGDDCDTRPYQIKCLEKADEALISGKRRMLFEMATGTGKTMTIALLIKRWFQAGLISRVLFLADRIELARQAYDDFADYLRDYPITLLFGGKKSLEGQVVVGTLDTIAGQLGEGGFGHAYFDLVITDECHRSIYNTHSATLGHFDAIHIGLTATPNPGELRWISHHERLAAEAPQKPLEAVASPVRRPITTTPEGSYPELGLRSFGKGTFHKPALSGTEVGSKRIFRIHAGDLVFSNVFAWEGAIAVAQPEDDGRAGSHRYITYLADPEQSTAEFLCWHFLTPRGLEDIRAASPGSAGRNRTLGLERLKQIQVPVPPIEEQRRFTELVKRQREITKHAASIAEDLRKFEAALLAKAFRGEL